jgi:hypothetical protein
MRYKSLSCAIAMSVGVLAAPPSLAETLVDSSEPGYWKDLGNVVNIDGLGKGGDPNIPLITEQQFRTIYSGGDLSNWQIKNPESSQGWNHSTFDSFGNGHDNRAVIYKFELSSKVENVKASFAVDNGVFLWVNGSYVNGATAGGGASRWEHVFPVESSLFVRGTNYVYVMPHNHGGGSGYAFQLTGDIVKDKCEHASYDLKKRTLTVPFVEFPVVDFLSGQATGEVELWTETLKKVSENRFRLLHKTVKKVTDGSRSDCPATYALKTGTLSIPYVDVPTGIVVGGKQFEDEVEVFKVILTWEPLGRNFMLQEVEKRQ